MGGSLLVARALVLCGAGALISALIPLRKLVLSLPPGIVRLSWRMLMALILFWIMGAVFYGIVFLAPNRVEVDLVFPGIFFSAAVFVCLSSLLPRQTMLAQENVGDRPAETYNRRNMEREFARMMKSTAFRNDCFRDGTCGTCIASPSVSSDRQSNQAVICLLASGATRDNQPVSPSRG